MDKYRKKPVVIEAEIYQDGMEDGFICNTYESGTEVSALLAVVTAKAIEMNVNQKVEQYPILKP